MRVCPKCGKANRPERKYCIRCGAKLVATRKRKRKVEPKPEVPETGRVVIGAAVAAAKEKAEAAVSETAATPHAEIVEEEWVRPSQVSRDRIRTTRKKHQKSEIEKAREAFEKAQSVDIDERMLRASEVKELFNDVDVESTTVASTPITFKEEISSTEEITTVDATKVDDSEVRLLGTMSPMVDSAGGTAMASAVTAPPSTSSGVAPDLASSLYDSVEVDESKLPTAPPETPVTVKATPPSTTTVTPSPAMAAFVTKEETVSVCPQCGTVMYVDAFEYPSEIYSQMGQARLKQARFFVVQGKYTEARSVIRIARSLFTHANDETGLEQADRLIESLARSA